MRAIDHERVTVERYTLAQAATLARVPAAEIIKQAKAGDIPRAAHFGGRLWSFDVYAFRRWAREHHPKPAAPTYKRNHQASRVYFIQAGEFVKIGFSNNVRHRMQAIQNGSPVPVRLLFVTPGGPRIEREFHRRFAEHRTLNEWFKLEGALAEFIKERCRG